MSPTNKNYGKNANGMEICAFRMTASSLRLICDAACPSQLLLRLLEGHCLQVRFVHPAHIHMMHRKFRRYGGGQFYVEGSRALRYGFSRESMDRSGVIPRDWIT